MSRLRLAITAGGLAFVGCTVAGGQERAASDTTSAPAQSRAGPPATHPCSLTLPFTKLERPFAHRAANAYVAHLPALLDQSDNAEAPTRSTLVLCENGRPLGPAHSLHDDVEKSGNGKFSHWREGVIFSSSDNTDPNGNGRDYAVVQVR